MGQLWWDKPLIPALKRHRKIYICDLRFTWSTKKKKILSNPRVNRLSSYKCVCLTKYIRVYYPSNFIINQTISYFNHIKEY